jgi:hypothetical protein
MCRHEAASEMWQHAPPGNACLVLTCIFCLAVPLTRSPLKVGSNDTLTVAPSKQPSCS